MLAICLTAASPSPRKATLGCFHVFAWYWTKSDRHMLHRVIETEKKIVPTTRYRLQKWNTFFNEKSNVTILTYIRISYEYEYFGSARTPVTKSSTRDHTASLICFTQDQSIPRSLQRQVSMKSSISQLAFFLFYNNCYRETMHDCSYNRERTMSSVSPYSSILWVTATISITACVQQMAPEAR